MSENEIFMRVAVDSLAFFALSSEEVVELDAAVRQLESIAGTLQDLNQEERERFREFVANLADVEMKKNGNSRQYRFLIRAIEDLGLE